MASMVAASLLLPTPPPVDSAHGGYFRPQPASFKDSVPKAGLPSPPTSPVLGSGPGVSLLQGRPLAAEAQSRGIPHIQNPHPDTLLAKYQLMAALGAGGSGFVHRVRRRSDSREFACKFILRRKVPLDNLMRDPSLGVVPSEVYLLRHLSHPSMVRFVDYFHDQHYYYLVMSTVSEAAGSDLFDAIETERFSEAKARTIFAQLVSVFAYLHSHGVYHGDLKDENCLLDDSTRLILIDFGSAFISNSSPFAKDLLIKRSSVLCTKFYGTVQYAAPEILMGQKFNPYQADIWSLGCLLFIMLFGEIPFSSPTSAISGKIRDQSRPVSPLAWDLIRGLLQCRIPSRWNAKTVVQSAWFQTS